MKPLPPAPVLKSLFPAEKLRLERIVHKVVADCLAQGRERDLLLEIYLAGQQSVTED